jgi:hypothetical protein
MLGAVPAVAAAGHTGGVPASPTSALAARAPATPFVSLPIGAGEAFQPPARWPLAGQASFGGLRGDIHAAARAHLEVFAYRQVVVIPGGIGVSGGRTELYGTVVDAPAHARAWTLQPGGVIQLAAPGITLGEFFAVWGQPLDLGFAGEVRAFVNGVERHGDPARIALHDADQVVITVGGYVPPHRRFTFTPRRTP